MELALQFQDIFCYEATAPLVSAHEESMETAVPEYCPDIARIVDTVGCMMIRERELNGNKAAVSGIVKVTVLYTSEDVAGLRSMSISVPFCCTLEDPSLENCSLLCAEGRILLAEARVLTSRKLYIKVLPEVTVVGYRPIKQRLCIGTQEEATLRQHSRTAEIDIMSAISEKEFSFTDTARMDSGTAPEDVLLYRICPTVFSAQRLGNKLMVKGEAWCWMLYRDEEQKLRQFDAALPLSQILDAAELPEEAEHVLHLTLRECDVRPLRTDDGCGFSLTARLGVCIRCYQHRTLHYIDDLYSIRFDTVLKRQEAAIPLCLPDRELRQEAQLRLEMEGAEPFAAVTGIDCLPAETVAAESGVTLRTALHLRLLYLDESGAPITTERTAEISAPADGGKGRITACCGRTLLQCAGNTYTVRLPVSFWVETMDRKTIHGITAAELSEPKVKDGPNLVLCRMGEGETLWDIAKRYQTDEEAIREANQLENDAEAAQYMLLIPKTR